MKNFLFVMAALLSVELPAAETQLNYQFAETSHGKIAYVDTGGSGFPVVLLHGNSCSSEVFKYQIAAFRDRYRMIAIDLPGHGRSSRPSRPDEAYTIPGYAKIAEEVVQGLGLHACAVLGFSLGGNIALQWTEISNRIKGIMIISCAPMKYSQEVFLSYPPYEGGYATHPEQLTEAQAMQYTAAVGFQVGDPSVRFMIDDAIKTDGEARAKMVASVLGGKGIDETEIVGRLPILLAIIAGSEDRALGLDYIAHLHYQNLWHGKLELIPKASHAIILHQREQLNRLIGRFLMDIENHWNQNSLSDPAKGPLLSAAQIELIPYSALLAFASS
jgi:pimeloyl-ACP methyl ester carboxylesterase